jgi:hypothetical protein
VDAVRAVGGAVDDPVQEHDLVAALVDGHVRVGEALEAYSSWVSSW